MNVYVVIMAGGSGERFWPLSRLKRPKQLLKLTSSTQTMLEEAVDRIQPIVPLSNVLIVTSVALRQAIIDAMPFIPAENVIAEPCKRNTAPCLALACSIIQARGHDDAVMAVLTADHFIGSTEKFRTDVASAIRVAAEQDVLVTLGIPPTRPETGYGYIEVATADPDADGAFAVSSFREKPDATAALEYLARGNYVWNSGMFFWRVQTFATAMRQHAAEVGERITPMRDAIAAHDEQALADIFQDMPDISIDYGLMERARNVRVVRATFPWDDVGSWDAIPRVGITDAHHNVVMGDVLSVDTTNSIVVNQARATHTVATLGVSNVVVVVTDDATLVCSVDRSQDVKGIVAALRASGRDNLL